MYSNRILSCFVQWLNSRTITNSRYIFNYPIIFNTLYAITQSNTEDGNGAMTLSVILNFPSNSSATIYTNGTSNNIYWVNMIGV